MTKQSNYKSQTKKKMYNCIAMLKCLLLKGTFVTIKSRIRIGSTKFPDSDS